MSAETWTCAACATVFTARPLVTSGCPACGRWQGYRHDQPMTLRVGDTIDGLTVLEVEPLQVVLRTPTGHVALRVGLDGWYAVELGPGRRWGGDRTDWRGLVREVAYSPRRAA